MSSAIKNFFFLFLFSLLVASCNQKVDTKFDFSNSDKHAFSLIKTCVDILLITKPAMNTKNYVVNLSGYEKIGLDRSGVDSFIKLKEAILPATHDDSVIMGDLSDMYMKQSIMIRLNKITRQENGILLVEAYKFRSDKERIELELTLSRQANGYSFISARELKQ